MAKVKKKGLGKGLGALITSGSTTKTVLDTNSTQVVEGESLIYLDPAKIEPNPRQPRSVFNEETLGELADSIKRDGIQEPVIVRLVNNVYELVSGERRVRASIMAELDIIPAICRVVSDDDMLKLGLIENIQRENLNAIELAEAYQQLISEFEWTQEEMAFQVGKKRATITNTLRLLHLPTDVQHRVGDGSISMGHARALLALDSAKAQSAACRKIIQQGLSVRQVEKMASQKVNGSKKNKPPKDPNILRIEDDLRRSLGTQVSVRNSKNNKGRIEIEYYNLDDLERILDRLRN